LAFVAPFSDDLLLLLFVDGFSRCIFLASVVPESAAGRFLIRVDEMVEATLEVEGPKIRK
jgi:hypothetical protein